MIFRVDKTSDYTVMSNFHLRDKKMSLKAKGLLSWMLSNDNDWDYSIAGIVANCKENETAIKSTLKELQEFGYLEIKKYMPGSSDGEVVRSRIEYEYIIHEKPVIQEAENLVLEFLDVENPLQRNTNKRNTKKQTDISKDISTTTKPDFEFGKPKVKVPKQSLYSKCINLIDQFCTKGNYLQYREKLVQYLNLRLEIKDKPLYQNMWKGMLNALDKLIQEGQDGSKVIDQSIQRGYLTFYPVNQSTRRTQRNDNATCEHYTEQELEELRRIDEERERNGIRTRF